MPEHKKIFVLFFTLVSFLMRAQVTLNANGFGNTYEEINAVLAPAYNVIEVPDCAHTSFGRHIDEVLDADLNLNVFRFYAHVTPDNDRCINFDRQRTEIKTYDQSPNNLKATYNETVRYKWLFKLPSNFQSSPKFTHIHQIKSVGGPFSSMPMMTLTTRQNSAHRLQLRYAPQDTQSTIAEANIAPFLGEWIEATEVIHYNNSGTYSLVLKRVSDDAVLFDYNNSSIDTWQNGSSFARPKWGIYRSLDFPDFLQDEQVRFNSFSIEENPNLSVSDEVLLQNDIILVKEQNSDDIFLMNASKDIYDRVEIYDTLGRKLISELQNAEHRIDISSLKTGLHFVVLLKNNRKLLTLKFLNN